MKRYVIDTRILLALALLGCAAACTREELDDESVERSLDRSDIPWRWDLPPLPDLLPPNPPAQPDADGDGIPNSYDPDIDGDGGGTSRHLRE
jgi:hypothetical protein